MAGPWDEYSEGDGPWSDFGAGAPAKPEPKKGAGVIRRIADMTAVPVAQGVIGVPEAAVGLADLVTGGRAGKAAESVGFRPREAKQIIGDALYSDEQKAANQKVAQAEGFVDTALASLENPSTIVRTVAESAPSMLAGGAVSRLALKAAPALSPIAAGAIGEGAVAAGQNAEQVRQEDPEGQLSAKQSALLALSGAATGAISRLSGGAASRLGLADAETALAAGTLRPVVAEGVERAAKKGVARKISEGFITEGLLEEMPQSMQEQVFQNLAQGKPWNEGVGAAGATGLLAGGLMGAAVAPLSRGGKEQPPPQPKPLLLGYDANADQLIGFPDGTVARRSEMEAYLATLQPEQRADVMAKMYGYGPQPISAGDFTTSPGAAPPAVASTQPAGEVQAPNFGTSPGAAPARDGIPFERDIATGDLAAIDPAAEAARRAQGFDFEPQQLDPTAGWTTSPGAGGPQPGVPFERAVNTNLEIGPIERAMRQLALPAPGQYPPGQDLQGKPPGDVGSGSQFDLQARTANPPPEPDTRAAGDWRDAARPIGPIERAARRAAGLAVPPQGQTAPQNGTSAAASDKNVPRGTEFVPQPGDIVVDDHFDAAHAAATSPLNDRSEPTVGQKDAGNYAKGHVKVGGLDISIENPQGSKRSGVDADGKPWETELKAHYGYIRHSEGADGDHVDVFIKPGTPRDFSGMVYVVDQVNPKTGRFDEHKVIFGAANGPDAARIYRSNYAADWMGFGDITAMPMAKFKEWVRSKDATKRPVGNIIDSIMRVERERRAAAAATSQGGAEPSQGAGPEPGGDGGVGAAQAAAAAAPAEAEEKHIDVGARAAASLKGRLAAAKAAWDKNPMMAFIAKHGLYHEKGKPGSLKSEFSPDQQVSVAGVHIATFRKDGKKLDLLVQNAIEEGFLPEGGTERQLYDLIAQAIGGKRVVPVYAEGAAEQEMERRQQHELLERPSEEDVLAQQRQREEGERQEADERQQQADRQRADSERAEFELTGSDRPADANPRQTDLAAQPDGDQQQGVTDKELGQIGKEFAAAERSSIEDGEKMTHVFDPPTKGEVVRLADKVKVYHAEHGWMTPDEAKAKIAEWRAHARAQGETGVNSEKVVLSFFDLSGQWSQPWRDAGYDVWMFDIQDDPEVGDVNNFSTEFFGEWFGDFEGRDIHAIIAACPCTDFASSGARHFAAKDADGRTVASTKLVHQTLAAIEYFKPATWAIENPVGRIEKLAGLPPWRLSFDPFHVGDPYTKKTLVWGRFNADLPIAPVEPTEGSKMHRLYGGSSIETKNARSETPEGFAYSFFMANNAVDHPAMAVSNKYDRLNPKLIEQAIDAGVTPTQIDQLIEDHYYIELNDPAAEQALRDAAANPPKKKAGQQDLPLPPAEKPAPANRADREPVQPRKVTNARALMDAMGVQAKDVELLHPETAAAAVAQFNNSVVDFAEDGIHLGGLAVSDVPDDLQPSYRVAYGIARALHVLVRDGQKAATGRGSSPELEAAVNHLKSFLGKKTRIGLQDAAGKVLADDYNPVNNQPRPADVGHDESLLLMPCSEGKLKDGARAGDMYQGVMWQTLRTHRQDGATPHTVILSAEHGFITQDTKIDPYERKMDAGRREGLLATLERQTKVVADSLPAGKVIRDVQIVGGADYRAVMRATVAQLQAAGKVAADASVREATGGIGEQRQQLGQYLDGFGVAAEAGQQQNAGAQDTADTPRGAPSAQAPSAQETGGQADNPQLEGTPAETAPSDERSIELMGRIRSFWRDDVAPKLRRYFAAYRAFGAEALEKNSIKPKGMDPTEWLQSYVSRQSTWDGGRKTGGTDIQALSTKDLWPTTDGRGENLRKAMLEAVKALKAAPGVQGNWIKAIENGATTGLEEEGGAPPAATAAPATAAAKNGEPVNEQQSPAQGALPGVEDAAPGPKQEAKPGAVGDFGEKLPEARRNRGRGLSDEVKDDEWLNEPFSKLWPIDEHEQFSDPFVAALVFAARAEVPAKPRSGWRVKGWVEKAKALRDIGRSATAAGLDREALLQRLQRTRGLDQFANKVRLLEAIPREQWKRIGAVTFYPDAYSYAYDKDNTKVPSPYGYVEVDGKTIKRDTFDGVIAAAREAVGADKAPPTAAMKFEVRGPVRKTQKYIIVKTGDPEYRPLKEFDELPEARKFMRDNHAALVTAWDGIKDRDNVKERDLRRDVNRPRTGQDWRKGKDVTPEQFQKDFGFRGGEFGSWVTQGAGAKERQGLLNQAYDALQDLAHLLGIPPRAISLNGTLGIAFGSRGAGWASAHFEPGTLVINLTKTRGAGAIGHEWFHALDNYFARMRNAGEEKTPAAGPGFQEAYRRENFVTYKPEPAMVHTGGRMRLSRASLAAKRLDNPDNPAYDPQNWAPDPSHPQGVRPEVEEKWAELVKALNASPMAQRAAKIDKGGEGYWSQIIERGARSFENFILAKMQAQGFENDYLSNVVGLSEFPRDPARYPYLLPGEVAPVAQAFDDLFGSMQTKETDKGLALFALADEGGIWRSELEEAIGGSVMKQAPAKGWLDTLAGMARVGKVKEAELEWSGLREWLDLQGESKVSKQAVLDYLQANGVRVEEVVKGNANVDHMHERMMNLQEQLHAKGWRLQSDMDGSFIGISHRDDIDIDYLWDDDERVFRNEETDSQPPEDIAKIAEEYGIARDDYTNQSAAPDAATTQYSQYTLPGGENYRELLLTLPVKRSAVERDDLVDELRARDEMAASSYKSSHWDEPNIVAHIRMNERTDADGKRVLFIEELQSDWAQDGRRSGFYDQAKPWHLIDAREKTGALGEYATQQEAVMAMTDFPDVPTIDTVDARVSRKPRAPFVDKTDAWLGLALKRIVKYASDNGFDRVAFVNGQQNAARFGLSKAVDSIQWQPTRNPAVTEVKVAMKNGPQQQLNVRNNDGTVVSGLYQGRRLEEVVGERVAAAILEQDIGFMMGDGLDIGGEGMIAFYDKIVPAALGKLLPKIGGKRASFSVSMGDKGMQELMPESSPGERLGAALGGRVQSETKFSDQPGFDVTQAMRDATRDGMTMFRKDADQPGPRPSKPTREQVAALRSMPISKVQAAIDRLTDGWKGGIEVKVVASPKDLPIDNPQPGTKGLFKNGVGYVVASKHKTEQDIGRTLAHEVLAHHGLRNSLGEDGWRRLMAQVQAAANAGNPEIAAARDYVRKVYRNRKPDGTPGDYMLKEGGTIEADEVAARLIEQSVDEQGNMKPKLQFLKWVWAKIADFLRSKFPKLAGNLPFTMAELHGAYVGALRDIRAGRGVFAEQSTALAAARGAQEARGFNTREIQVEGKWRPTEDSNGRPLAGGDFGKQQAFWKWFGDSKVVDEKGRPQVVYHGTGANFNEFSSGNVAGHFTPDPAAAAAYAYDGEAYDRDGGLTDAFPNVMPLYLSIEKPLVLDFEWAKNNVMDKDGSIDWLSMEDRVVHDAMQEGYDGLHLVGWPDFHGRVDESGKSTAGKGKRIERQYDQWWAFKPEQIKSAIGNRGTFDPKDPDIRHAIEDDFDPSQGLAAIDIAGDTGRAYTPEQMQAMRNVGFAADAVPLKDRLRAVWKDAGKRLSQGIVDQFAPIRDISKDAYGLLRLSKGASGAFEVLLQGGQLKLNAGVYDFDEKKRGGVIERLLTPLQGEHHDFFRWIAANRAAQLAKEDRENLFSAQDIASLKTLADGTLPFDYKLQHGPRAGQTTRDRSQAYADSLATFTEFNKNTMDMAEQSGLIDPEARKVWERDFYVPFYRVEDEGGVRGMNVKSGVVRQQAFKQLKGGAQKLNADLLENTLMNWAHLIDAAAKNRAAKATLEAMQNLGAAVEAPEADARSMAKAIGKRNNVVWFMDDGKQRHFIIDDPYLLAAVSALEFSGFNSPVMKALGGAKQWLTRGVTASPFFKTRNLIRDTIQAIASAPLSANPLENLREGAKVVGQGTFNGRNTDEWYRLLAGGGTIHFGTQFEGSEAKRVQALVESGVDPANILDSSGKVEAFYKRVVKPLVSAYEELGNRGEAINRAALYQQLRKSGVSHAEASLQARDLMDFSMQGSFTTVRFLTQVVPFMNARIQGIAKLTRAAQEDPARFAAVLMAASVLSIGLAAAYADDDDWKKREDWDRNNYWWFKAGGLAYRIPKPFEIGAMATLAERTWELAVEPEMTGTRYRQQVMALLGDQLSMNPIPQAVKPILDVYSNKDSFTGRPIESMGMEKLQPQFRYRENTSMLARGASTALSAAGRTMGLEGPSPVQIDHLIRGYFGWLGTVAAASGDILARPATGQVSQPTPDYWKVLTGSMAAQLDGAQSRYVSQVYEQTKELEQIYGTWRYLLREGKIEEAQAFRGEYEQELVRYRQAEAVKRAITTINQLKRRVEEGGATPDEKRDRLRELNDRADLVARRLAPA